jgi:hypothetical protein
VGLRAPQLPTVNGALITGFRNITKIIKKESLIELEIDGISYDQYQ